MARRYTGTDPNGRITEVIDAVDYDNELAAQYGIVTRLTGQLAACYKAAADAHDDGDDWLLAGKALAEVQALRIRFDLLNTRIRQLETVIDQATAETKKE